MTRDEALAQLDNATNSVIAAIGALTTAENVIPELEEPAGDLRLIRARLEAIYDHKLNCARAGFPRQLAFDRSNA